MSAKPLTGHFGIPEGWEEGVMQHSKSNPGGGWTLREWNSRRTDFTDKYIQWHPGGGRHGPDPYWKVMSGKVQARIGTSRYIDPNKK